MKVSLVTLNARYTHSALSLYCLKKSLEGICDVEITEYNINLPYMEILCDILGKDTDVLCFSVYIWNSIMISGLINDVKKIKPGIKIVVGGPEVGYSAQEWLNKHPAIDFVISGPGEAAIRSLAEKGFSSENRVISLPNPPFKDVPFPYDESDLWSIKEKYVYYESSRGCPFACPYCLSSREDIPLEYRPLDLVKKEIGLIVQAGVKTVKFVDRTFNSDRKRAREIWKYIIAEDPSASFHFEIYPALLENEDFEILSKARNGMFRFEVGIQSTNPSTLKYLKRNYAWDEISVKVEKLLDLGNIHVHLDLIAGLPFESLNDFICSFNDLYSTRPHHFQLGFLKCLPGTEIDRTRDEHELVFLDRPPYTILRNKYLSFQEISSLFDVEKLVDYIHNPGRFNNVLEWFFKFYGGDYFRFFQEVSSFCRYEKLDIGTKKWENIASVLLKFSKFKNFPKKETADALRYDWCVTSKGYGYPIEIVSERVTAVSRKTIKIIRSMKDDGMIDSGFKKYLAYRPKTQYGRRLASLDGDLILLFVYGEKGNIAEKLYVPGR